ncbi:hypothetical protein AVEN_111939-1 [Araneus ventricosus]|uniref:Uncharacterized protein n=1 Tax=Araneus ventricosus TaxID=182803 RepID=A0A4Y2R2X6_ARAVE|nr:hypothetical protein AVEN_111939-1 [Araneus ventricosus]
MHICLFSAPETVTSRSPDLTPMVFVLWEYLKQQVYATPPPTLQDIQRHITDTCTNVTPAMLHHVQREIQARIQMCNVADGEKFEHRKERYLVITSVFFLSKNVLSRLSVGNREQTNTYFKRSVLSIYVRKVSFCTKSMMLYNFVIHFFLLSRIVLEIITLTLPFSTRWRCNWFHPVAPSHFTMPIHHSYEGSCSHSVVKRVVRDFSGHPVY